MSRRWAGALLWMGLIVFTGGLWWAGRGLLVGPSLAHPSRWTDWWSARGPIVATFSALRVGLVGVGLYFIGLGVVGGISATRLRQHRLPGSRLVLRLTAGASSAVIASSAMVAVPGFADGPAPATGPAPGPDSPPELRYLGPAPGTTPPRLQYVGGAHDSSRSTTSMPSQPAAPSTHPAPSKLPPPEVTRSTRSRPTLPRRALHRPAPPAAPSPPAARPESWGTWVVRPGDDLWSIAEAHLAGTTAEAPDLGVVAAYWQRVIAVNRARLPDPANPNLIFSGETVLLPPAPAPTAEPTD